MEKLFGEAFYQRHVRHIEKRQYTTMQKRKPLIEMVMLVLRIIMWTKILCGRDP